MDSFEGNGCVFDSKFNIKQEPELTIIDVAEFVEDEELAEIKDLIKSEEPAVNLKKTKTSSRRSPLKLKPEVIFCDICYRQFKSTHVLETHKLKIHDGTSSTKKVRPFEKCKLCNKSVLNLKTHEEISHAKPSYQCLLCSFVTKYSGNLEAHKRSVHKREAQFPCYECGKEFKDQSNRNRHVRQMHKKTDVKYECHICPLQVSFSRSDNLNLHLKRIHGLLGGVKRMKSLLTCDFCAATFLTKLSIIRHFRVMHLPEKPKPFRCKICMIGFTNKDYLKNHLDSTHLHKFHCRHCKKPLGSSKTLKTHELKKKCLR